MEAPKSSFLALPVEIRPKIYGYIQPQHCEKDYRVRGWTYIRGPGMVKADAIALSTTSRQVYCEMIDFYTSKRPYHVNIRNTSSDILMGYRPPPSNASIEPSDLSVLSKAKHVQIDTTLTTQRDHIVHVSRAADVLALMSQSRVVQSVQMIFQMRDPPYGHKLATKQNVAICKLRMQTTKEGRQQGKEKKEIEVDFGMRAIELIKSWST